MTRNTAATYLYNEGMRHPSWLSISLDGTTSIRTKCFDSCCHSVCSVHTATGALARACMLNDFLSFFFRNLVIDVLTVGLKGADDIQRSASGRLNSGANSSSIYHDAWSVQAGHRHNTARHILVTSRQCNQTIIPLCSHGSFDRISNQVSTLQRVSHASGTHRDTIRDADSIESVSNTVYLLNTRLDIFGKLEQVHVAGVSFVPYTADSNLRFAHVRFLQTSCIEHSLRGALRFGSGQDAMWIVERVEV